MARQAMVVRRRIVVRIHRSIFASRGEVLRSTHAMTEGAGRCGLVSM
jgi:hypothetical protein